MHIFVSLSDVTDFRQTLVLVFIVWLNWFDTEQQHKCIEMLVM